MNWYKKAQSKNYPIWLAQQVAKYTDNYQRSLGDYPLKIIEEWIRETNPDLTNLELAEAGFQAKNYQRKKQYEKTNNAEQINRHWNKFISETQNINPDSERFAVDLRLKSQAVPTSIKKKINKSIHALGNYHNEIPLDTLFDILKEHNIVALQEDGTIWSGILTGGAECGSDKAREQYASFNLAIKLENEYLPSKSYLMLNWCKMPSGKYEIVSYIT